MAQVCEVVRAFRVFRAVHTGGFGFGADPESDGPMDGQPDDSRPEPGQQHGEDDGDQLGGQLLEPAAVEQPAADTVDRQGDEAQRESADQSAAKVDADDVERVIKTVSVLQVHKHGAGGAGEQAQADGGDRTDVGAGWGDGNETGDNAGRGAEGGGVPVADLFRDQPAEQGRGRSSQRVDPDQARLLGRRRGAGVEAEPAEPQDAGAQHDEGYVVRAVGGVLAEPLAVAQNQHQDQRGGAGTDLHHGPAGEVDHLPEDRADGSMLAHQATAPDHEGERAVDNRDPDGHEEGPRGELGAVGDGAADQCHGDDGEGRSVAGLNQFR
ncbi:hypothetical protein QFZ79_001926 [Arthrobacter sp. V4I6]|nr:hypothetical protein [Arthrobacter sp. V4I6]